MTIALLSLHSKQYSELAALTWEANKASYCFKHGYRGINYSIDYNKETAGPFKFEAILQLFKEGVDWVWATGCDSMVTNFTIDLSELINTNASIVITTDRNGINSDSYLIKNDIHGEYILRLMLQRAADGHYLDEQTSLISASKVVRDGVIHIVPQRFMNSYNYDLYPLPHERYDKLGTNGNWQHGDLLIHWPGYSDNPEMRVTWAKEFMSKVKYE